MDKAYRIAWKGPKAEGHGEWMCNRELAEGWLKYAQDKYPEMTHWIEEKK